MEWLENSQIQIEPPKKPKKITGTRFASILDMDRWNSPFKTWCAITRTYEEPFTDNKFTIAGKTIEPKIIDYLNKVYYFGDLKSPTDIYGKDYFKQTWGDFFGDEPVFGGMWDALVYEDGKPTTVIEIKTTKRAEDWTDGAPLYYALQASLYAHLLGVEDVVMVAAFLEESDYDHPDKFIPSADNTITDAFVISERFPDLPEKIDRAMAWWTTYVTGGTSPYFDEKKDEEILKVLRTNNLSPGTDIAALITEGDQLKADIEAVNATVAKKEKRLKVVTDLIKQNAMTQFRDGDKKVSLKGILYDWTVTKTSTIEIDKVALKADGLLDKYTRSKDGYKITPTLIKKKEK